MSVDDQTLAMTRSMGSDLLGSLFYAAFKTADHCKETREDEESAHAGSDAAVSVVSETTSEYYDFPGACDHRWDLARWSLFSVNELKEQFVTKAQAHWKNGRKMLGSANSDLPESIRDLLDYLGNPKKTGLKDVKNIPDNILKDELDKRGIISPTPETLLIPVFLFIKNGIFKDLLQKLSIFFQKLF